MQGRMVHAGTAHPSSAAQSLAPLRNMVGADGTLQREDVASSVEQVRGPAYNHDPVPIADSQRHMPSNSPPAALRFRMDSDDEDELIPIGDADSRHATTATAVERDLDRSRSRVGDDFMSTHGAEELDPGKIFTHSHRVRVCLQLGMELFLQQHFSFSSSLRSLPRTPPPPAVSSLSLFPLPSPRTPSSGASN